MPNPTIHVAQAPDVRPPARRVGSAHYPLPPVSSRPPPSIARRMTAEGASLRLPQPVRRISEDGFDISALQRTLPQIEAGIFALAQAAQPSPPSPRSPGRAPSRAPSPLPSLPAAPLPSDIQAMSTRLLHLVQQSNSYVAGLSRRLDMVEAEFRTLGLAATLEELATFLEVRPPFAALDPARLQSFGLPLYVWERIATQVVAEYDDEPGRGLESVLYWRGRAEAEALGLLHADHRGSEDSRRSTVLSIEWPSVGSSRRSSLTSTPATSSLGSQLVASPGSQRPSLPRAGSSYGPPRQVEFGQRLA